MRWAERCALALLVCSSLAANAAEKTYNQVDTFEPGKKYNCVPTADRKAWNCEQSGKADNPPPPKQAAPPLPNAEAARAQTPAPRESVQRASELPAYLSAGNASGGAAPRISAEPAPLPKVEKSTNPPPAPKPGIAAKPEPVAPPPAKAEAAAPAPPKAETPAAAPIAKAPEPAPIKPPPPAATTQPISAQPSSAPPPAAVPPPAPTPAAGDNAPRGNREFLALPPTSYVVEIAHAANRTDLDALRASLHLPLGELYEVHLSRDGGDWWLLLWGHFADVDSARAARSDLPSDKMINAGWPRRTAPLQAEARRIEQ